MTTSTTCVHAGTEPEPQTGAVMTPIFQTSTFHQESPGVHRGFDYSRADNPTRQALETALAALEHAPYGLAFASGLAAEQAILQTLTPPGEIIVCDDVYGGTGRLFRKLFAKYGFKFRFVDMREAANVEEAITTETQMIWVETPTNPTLRIIDIAEMARLAKKAASLLVVDNTFASPINQLPLELGADIVIHSTTKYIGGHSDLIGGAVMTRSQELFDQLKFVQFAAGAVPSPLECFLIHRSIKTLAVRMQRHNENGLAIARFLEDQAEIEQVYYPGLTSHRGHEIAKQQMTGFSGMVSFNLKGDYDKTAAFIERLKVFSLAESLGGVESLVNHPERMTHASVPPKLREELGIGPNLLRLSCGIEAVEDLQADLRQALR